MAQVSYNKRCSSCGGNKWEYLKELKVWRCIYCDSQVQRQEQRDELYSIKNVARQVILDVAYRRMAQAERNLSECERMNSRYAGTLIAGICCRMIAAFSGMSLGGQDPRALVGQIRRDYTQLTEEDDTLGDDETALYEFLDSSDAWAALAMVFDTLGDQQRCEYLLTMTEPDQVFAKETNKSLLRFALKNDRLDLAEQVLANRGNVDTAASLDIILHDCPDGEAKARMAALLIKDGAVRDGDMEDLEAYLSGSDSAATKAAVACAACNAGLPLRMELLAREIPTSVELSEFQQLLAALFKRRLNDAEIEQLLGMAETVDDPEKCMAILDAMSASGQFVALNVKQAQAFIFKTSMPVEHRVEILQKLRGFSAADKLWETVTGAYLCQVSEPVENRTRLLDALSANLASIPAKDFEQYVLCCPADGEQKTEHIRKFLSLPNMSAGFFRELPGKYMRGSKDDPKYRSQILQELLKCGLSIDGSVLLEYVCSSASTADEKTDMIQLALQNGTVLRTDAISIYLERCVKTFAPQVFTVLYRDGAVVSAKALENYVLYCKDVPSVKVKNATALAKSMGIPFGSSNCRIKFKGSVITCSLAQAYILLTTDAVAIANDMVREMVNSGTKLTTAVEADGVSKKFSKVIQEKRDQLSPVAENLCQTHRLFTRLF